MVETYQCAECVPHLGPIYTKCQHQCCDDTCDSVLIENKRIAPEWDCNSFSSDSTVFNENRITSVIAALMLTLGVNGPLVSCPLSMVVKMVIFPRYIDEHHYHP